MSVRCLIIDFVQVVAIPIRVFTIDTPVEIVGDKLGHDCLLDLPLMIGKKAIVESAHGDGFWWVRLDNNNRILLHENELKEIDAS